ncbi:MAG TPA: hypothetical protein VNO23_01075 [Candidatus Binatia bacterium]|jgi:hypothetical protein|nr:hypothetical protein [Candidatus Binatia bacterium]
MRSDGELQEMREASTASLAAVVGILIGAALAFTAATAPINKLLGSGAAALPAALHGLTAFLYLFVGTIGLYLGWRLMTGRIRAFADLQLLSTVSATLSFLAIVAGNWLYIYYRANTPESPRSSFLKTMPEVHRVFFEFKEFAALFTLPLTVAAAFILWHYGGQVVERRWLRYSVAVLLGLSFFYLVVAFGLGAAVTKLRPA